MQYGISSKLTKPLSCSPLRSHTKRTPQDMADLAKTSRMNVTFDLIMVALVLYCAPIRESWATFDWKTSIIHTETIFIGLGVLSFAFVCQHSAFIIAGSLDSPTKSRWATVTQAALMFACALALCCGAGGYIGFQETTQGNILNSLDKDSLLPNIARGLLGTTMLFVYPMVSFTDWRWYECTLFLHVLTFVHVYRRVLLPGMSVLYYFFRVVVPTREMTPVC